MKRILVLCLILAFLLTACGKNNQVDGNSSVVSKDDNTTQSDIQTDDQSSELVDGTESATDEVVSDDSWYDDTNFGTEDGYQSPTGQLTVTTTVTKAEVEEILPGEDTADLLNPQVLKNAGANTEALAMRKKVLNAKDNISVKGTTYYVSPKGDDSNDGKSAKTPFETLSNAFSLAKAGDAILLERGSVFRLVNTLTLESGVTYGAYGTGPKPEIWGSIENYAQELRWQPYNIRNVWAIDFIGSDVGIIVFNHGELAGNMEYYVRNLKKNGDYFFDDTQKMLYVYCDKGNPGKVYDDIEIGSSKVLFRLRNGAENVTIDNLSFKYTGTFGIHGSMGCKNINIKNCVVGWIGGSLFADGSNRYGNGIEFTAGCENLTVENCWLYQIYDAAFTFQITNADGDVKERTYKNIRVKNNIIEYSSWAFEWWPSDSECVIEDVLVDGNIMRFSGYGWASDTRIPSHLRGSWSAKDFTPKNFAITKNIFDCSNGPVYAWVLYNPEQLGDSIYGNKYYQKSPSADRKNLFAFEYLEKDATLYNVANQKELNDVVKMIDPKATLIKWIK